jgi:hypothetical protein
MLFYSIKRHVYIYIYGLLLSNVFKFEANVVFAPYVENSGDMFVRI